MFLLVWTVLMVAPSTRLLLALHRRRRSPVRLRRRGLFCVAYMVIVLLAAWFGARTNSPQADLAVLLTVFLAYNDLAFAVWFFGTPIFRLVGIVMAAGLVLSTLLATVGVPALAFLVSDAVSYPYHVARSGPALVCEVSGWGAASGPSGYSVALYRTWRLEPFLRRRVMLVRVDQRRDRDVTCANVLATLGR